MATLNIPDLDDDIIEKLQARADSNGRSLEKEIRHILTQAARSYELAAHADRIAKMTLDVPQTDSAEIIRKFHDR